MSDVASGFVRLLDWAQSGTDLKSNGARIAALSTLLNPAGRYRSLAAIARDAGVSRAIVSRWLLELRDRFNVKLSLRGSLIRENCSAAQHHAVAVGRHASIKTRKTQPVP